MSKLREAAQAALEALENDCDWRVRSDAARGLRAALAESDSDWSLLAETQASLREHMAEIHQLRAALAEQKVYVPKGWKLVPTQPTAEMLAATSWPGCATTDYAHMIAAAPMPPRREWVPLTEQEIWDSVKHGVVGGIGVPSKAVAVARAIEVALKEKNQ